MYKFDWVNLRKRYVADQCWTRNNSIPNNRNFIRVSVPGSGEEILCFRDTSEMTVENALHMVRYLTKSYKDHLYIVDEHGKELMNPQTDVQHGRTYRCKRR